MYSHTIPSRIVKKCTKYNWTHIAISLNKSCDKIYSFGRKSLKSAFHGGFITETKNGEFYTKFNNSLCRIYELEVEDEKYESLESIISEMEKNKEKYKYDYFGAVLRFFKIHAKFKNKYVCSYFVAYLLEKSNIHNFNKEAYLVTPKDFEDIGKEIYLGNYVNMSLT